MVSQAITDVFGNIFGGIINLAKVPINAVIKAINWVLESINDMSIEIPDWVPGLGGEKLGFNLSTIPLLASGGVATAPTLAMVGEGTESEAILPLSRLESMLSGGAAAQTNDVSIVFSPTINISGGQGNEVQTLNEARIFRADPPRDRRVLQAETEGYIWLTRTPQSSGTCGIR